MANQVKKGSDLGKARSVGEFCWVDVAARDIAKETNFFKQTLNWDVREIPMPQGAYPMIFVGDSAVGGFMDLQRLAKGTPPHLAATIRVDKIDKAFALALKSGAREISKPSEVGDMGKIAVIADPTGAAVNLWEVIKHEGISADSMIEGVPSWFELMTNQPDISQKFYKQAFGWEARKTDAKDMEYLEFYKGSYLIGGLFPLTKNIQMPNAWCVYFTVRNIDKTLAQATKGGAKVVVPVTQAGSIGKFAGLTSPQGAYFGVVQYNK